MTNAAIASPNNYRAQRNSERYGTRGVRGHSFSWIIPAELPRYTQVSLDGDGTVPENVSGDWPMTSRARSAIESLR